MYSASTIKGHEPVLFESRELNLWVLNVNEF